MSQLRKLNQTQTKEKGVAVVTPQRSYSNLLEDLIKDLDNARFNKSNLAEHHLRKFIIQVGYQFSMPSCFDREHV